MTAPGVYSYGVVRAGQPLPEGCGGVGSPSAPVRLVRAGRVAAVVSEAPAELRARRRDLMAHQELLLRLAEKGPVVPMRFGVVSPDEERLVADLARSEPETVDLLEHLDGRCEMNFKASAAESGLASLVREDEGVRRLRAQARRQPSYEANVRLGEAVSAGLTRRATEAAEQAVLALAPLAVELTEGAAAADCVRSVSFLIERDRLDAFRATVTSAAARYGQHADLRVTGPLPCYSFAGSAPARAAV